MNSSLNRLATLALVLCFTFPVRANDGGGGTNGVGANVSLALSGTTATLANGVITATIDTSSGKVTSYLFYGTQMLDTSGLIYYSMDGGTSYEQPGNCVYSVTKSNPDMVDISCKLTWANHTNRVHAFDMDCHYVLRRGDTGLYAYAILAHPASYPDTSVGEWRIVWKLPHNATDWTFENIYVDALRNWYWGSYTDFLNEAATGIAEIKTLTTGARAGQMDCKYEYAAEYQNIGCWGHASATNKIGVWFVLGGYDYLNDGPNMTDLTVAESYLLQHFGRDHFGGSGTSVAAGETWSKIFGPFLLYCNQTTATSHQGDALWADAKAQVQAEVAAWPYSWLTNSDYPADSLRGAVTGKIILTDPLKPLLAAGTNTWVGVSQPDPGGNWQFDSKHYQGWVHPDPNGSFSLAHLRPGTYTLSAWTVGAVGEFTWPNIVVTAGSTNALGNLNWTNPHPGGQIAWEIGIPDRSAAEFRHGTNYWYPYLWMNFSNDFSNPLTYNVGTSNWTNDWNYAQPGYLLGPNWSQWKWRINFTLTNLPTSGSATMTFAIASIYYGAVDVYVNDESAMVGEVAVNLAGGSAGGNALIREGIHAKYGLGYQTVPLSSLRVGTNTITLIQRSVNGGFNHVMYDYVNLELPPGPPAPPPGRNLIWRGGDNANAWDLAVTTNWIIASNGVATTFTNGDNVTFDDSGSNALPVSVNAAILPGSVAVTAAKNYTFASAGSLMGTMYLFKGGNGTLTLNGSNAFGSGTTISSGIVQLGAGETNNAGSGSGPITLGGTLRLNGYAASTTPTWAALPNDLIVPVGQSGTLGCPPRIGGNGISGRLTGGGILNLMVDYVRGLVSGDWSLFSGQINVTARRASPNVDELRVKPSQGYPNAAIHLGPRVNFYNLNGGTPTYDIGELSGDAGALLSTPGGNSAGQPVIWRVGGLNTSAEFAGTITDQIGLIKIGTGTLTLSGTNSYTLFTGIGAGTLRVSGSITTTNFVVVSNSATLDLPGALTANTVQINAGGTLTGCGTINGNLLNNGNVTADGALGFLTINGNVTNNGVLQLLSGTALNVTGTFVNNGLLDLISGAQTLPANFINHGTVLTSANIVVNSVTQAGGTLTLTIQGYDGHTYQMQRSATLNSANWQNTGSTQDGLNAPLTFTDPPGGSQNFYRILVAP